MNDGKAYEEVARQILHEQREFFGFERVEGKQDIPAVNGTIYEIDAVAYGKGDERLVLFECRDYNKKLTQEAVGGFAYRIQVIGAAKGYMVTQALARLNHSHIVTVHDFGDVDGLYYFTMEYVDGHNLRDLLQAGALPAAQVLAIVPQLCDALQYAHDEGLVHRDIKPENILLDKRGRVKIADFGLAKLVGLTPTYLTLTGTHEVMGTLLYMAPEQMKRTHTVDHRADIYSLGVVLYEMLTGELPLGRFAPPSHKAAVNERLDQVVLRALAREPAERYQDAAAFKHDVETALGAMAPGTLGCVSARRAGHRLATGARRVWPSARFDIRTQGGEVAARGLMCRDEEALILEFEFAKNSLLKKFKAFLKEPGRPQEVRIGCKHVCLLLSRKEMYR